MDPVSISGRQGQTVTGARQSSSSNNNNNNSGEWNGYQWNIPLNELIDCDSAPECCQKCYYKGKGMSKSTKCVISAAIIAASIVLTALVVRFSLGPVDVLLGVGDQIPIINDGDNFSPLLCSQYRLTNVDMATNPVQMDASSSATSLSSSTTSNQHSTNAPIFDAYILMDTPYRSYHKIPYNKEETLIFPTENYFNYWAFNFELASEVEIATCSPGDSELKLHILQGQNALNKFLRGGDIPGILYHTFSPCSSSFSYSSYRHQISSVPNVYAFIFTISESGAAGTNIPSTPVFFTISRHELDFDDGAVFAACKDATHCSLPVPNKAAAVMLSMKQNATTWPMTIRAECVPSIGMYVAFFVGLPVGIVVMLATCGGILYLCQRSVIRDVERADRIRTTMSSHSASASSSRHSRPTSSTSATTIRAFRTTTSQQAPLVNHDVLSAMAEVDRQRDLPPLYTEVTHLSSPVNGNEIPLSHDDDPPPSYDSIVI